MKTVLAIFVLFCVTGCGGSLRVFQTKVPAPLGDSPKKVEAQRQAADLIARTIEAPIELKPVARSLSNSLGAPAKPLQADTPEEFAKASLEATKALNLQIVAMQQQLTKLNVSLVKLQGKEIEGTGLSMFGPGMATIIIGLIVLGVVFPPAFTVMAMIYRRTKAAAKIVVNELEEAANSPETRDAVQQIKSKISNSMKAHPQSTDALKNVVLNLKKA